MSPSRKSKRKPPSDPRLRAAAEARLAQEQSDAPRRDVLFPPAAVHELEVRQVQMEMQNEELLRTRSEVSALRASEEQLRVVLENSNDAIFWADAETGRLIRCNRKAEELTGRTRDELIGMHQTLLHPPDRDCAELLREVVAMPAADNIEAEVLTRTGKRIPVVINSAVVAVGPKRIVQGIFRDVSERKRAEEALAGALAAAVTGKNRLEAVMKALPVGLAIVDAQGGTLDTNPAFDQIWAGPRPPTRAIRDYAAYHAWWTDTGRPVAPEEWASARAVGQGESVVGQLMEIQRFDGSRGFVLNSAAPIRDATGRVEGAAVVIQDITGLRVAEAALRASEERLALVLQASSMGSFEVDLQTGQGRWNDTEFELVGLKPGQAPACAETFFRYVHPEDVGLVRAQWEEALRRGKLNSEFRVVRADGQVRWMAGRGEFVFEEGRGGGQPEAHGKAVRFLGVNYDITERKQAEAELRRAHERLERAQKSAGAGTWDWDLSSGKLDWSPALFGLYGLDPARGGASFELWRSVVHPEDLAAATEQIDAAVRNRSQLANEYRIVLPGGGTRWIHALGDVVCDSSGHVARMSGICLDITGRKRAEEQLLELSQRLSYHVDHSPLAVIEWGPDMRLMRWSGEAERIFGWAAQEVLGKRIEEFRWVVEEDGAQVAEVRSELVTGANPRRFSANRNYRKDGSIVHCEWYNSSLVDPSGKLRSILSLVLDVSARTRAEEALRESEARYRAIGESIDYGVWVCAPDGRNTYASASFLKLVGLTQEQCSSFGWGDVLHPDDAQRTLEAWKACVRTGGAWDIEHRFRGADGQWHPVLARGVPVRDAQGRITCWVGINLDISGLKHAEERLKVSLGEKEVLLKEIHHRVKNNLQIITSLVSLQAEALNDPALRGLFQNVSDRVRSMALVHEKLYRSESLAQVEFAGYARSLLQYLWRAHGAAAQRIRLDLELQPVSLSAETAVPCGLLLNELASNALKHAFSGRAEGRVTVGLERDGASGRVTLRVSDNGAGLPAGLDWRGAPSLGLRLVQMLVQQLHGQVEVCGGPGLEFCVQFTPAAEAG